MLPRMNCSVKFFDPTEIDLFALALFFLITLASPPLEEDPPPLLFLSSLPHAASATASVSAASAATSARIDRFMLLVPFVGIAGQGACGAAARHVRASGLQA